MHSCETGLVNGFWIDCADCNDHYHLEPVRDRMNIRDKGYSVILVSDTYKGISDFKLMHEPCDWSGSGCDKFLCELMYLYEIKDLLDLCCQFGRADWKISKFSSNCKRLFELYKMCFPDEFSKKRSHIDPDMFKEYMSLAIGLAAEDSVLKGDFNKRYLLRSDFVKLFYGDDVFNVTRLFSE